MKTILVIGNGGREHALVWKLAQSPNVAKVLVAPGNAGTAQEAKASNVDITPDQIEALVELAKTAKIDLTVVGPEVPLVLGIVDRFRSEGLRCFGPTKAAAQLEGSKAFCKDFLNRHQIPTADYQVFSESSAAKRYLADCALPIVLKADGLAAGKGVIIAQTRAEAEAAIDAILDAHDFGEAAGASVVIESFLNGVEASFIVVTDGETVLSLATSQDHKARDEGDQGPNTGGMGAYSPAPIVTPAIEQKIMDQVIHPTLKGLKQSGITYTGFLYAGLMIEADEVRVLEYNCRLGDPETQPILLRLDSDLLELCEAVVDQKLADVTLSWLSQTAVGVVMATHDYPNDYPKGATINGLDQVAGSKVFHAGTRLDGDKVVTNGGRVLSVVALGEDLQQAHDRAYKDVAALNWEGAFYRKDIAHKAL